MILTENKKGYVCYDFSPEEIQPWRYLADRPWALAANIAAGLLSVARPAYAFLFSTEWNDIRERRINEYGDIDWNTDPCGADEDTIVAFENTRVIFPRTREALDQAAVCASMNGIFIVSTSVPKADVLAHARISLEDLTSYLKQSCKAFVFPSIFGIEVETFAADDEEKLIRENVHDSIMLWLDPGQVTLRRH